jgi:hypothetical protein
MGSEVLFRLTRIRARAGEHEPKARQMWHPSIEAFAFLLLNSSLATGFLPSPYCVLFPPVPRFVCGAAGVDLPPANTAAG